MELKSCAKLCRKLYKMGICVPPPPEFLPETMTTQKGIHVVDIALDGYFPQKLSLCLADYEHFLY